MTVDTNQVLTVAIPSLVTALGLWLNYKIQKADRQKGSDAAELRRLSEAESVRHELQKSESEVKNKVDSVTAGQNKVLVEIHEKVNGNLDALRAENQRLQMELRKIKTRKR